MICIKRDSIQTYKYLQHSCSALENLAKSDFHRWTPLMTLEIPILRENNENIFFNTR